eukprot:jgi/Mesen1/7734/ME000407S06969
MSGLHDPADEEDQRMARFAREKVERKKMQKEHELVIDELLPKATGREAKVEQKAMRRQAAREREVSPEMRERDIMGGGDDFKARLAREKAWRGKKAAEKANAFIEKHDTYAAKENAKMDAFKALVSQAGGRITIPKRNDQPP